MASIFHFVTDSYGWTASTFGSPTTLNVGATEFLTTSGYKSAIFGICISLELDVDPTAYAFGDVILDFRVVQLIQDAGPWNVKLKIFAPLVLDATEPASQSDCLLDLAEPLTTPVIWEPEDYYLPDDIIYTPNFASVLQEVVDQVGWASGNRVNIYITAEIPAYAGTHPVPVQRLELEGGAITPTIVLEPPLADAHLVDDLVLIQSFYAFLDRGDYSDTLEIEQLLDAVTVHTGVFEDTLVFVENYDYVKELNADFQHLLVLIETLVGNNTYNADYESDFTLQQLFEGNTPSHKQTHHDLAFIQDLTGSRGVNVEFEHTLYITQDLHSSGFDVEYEHYLGLVQEFDATGTFANAKNLVHTLVFEQDIGQNTIRTVDYEDTLEIEQAFTSVGGLASLNCRMDLIYCPRSSIIGFSDKPTIALTDVTLYCPELDLTIVLPKPNMNDRQELLLQRIWRENLGGDLIVYRDTYWQKTKSFRYKFQNLTDAKREEMFTFLSNTLGLRIELTDHEGLEWSGYVLNAQGESGKFYRECGNTTEFDFEDNQA